MKSFNFKWTEDSVKNFWDMRTEINPNQYFCEKFGKDVLRTIKNKVNIQGKILDFGCGAGHLSRLLLSGKKNSVTCADISPNNVELVNHTFSHLDNFKGAHLGNELFFEKHRNNFDYIFVIECIEHILPEKLNSYIKDLISLLKKGGVLIITTVNQEDFSKEVTVCPNCCACFHKIQHVSSWSVQSLSKQMESLGLKTQHCYTTAFSGYWYLNYIYGLAHKFYYGHKPNLIYLGERLS